MLKILHLLDTFVYIYINILTLVQNIVVAFLECAEQVWKVNKFYSQTDFEKWSLTTTSYLFGTPGLEHHFTSECKVYYQIKVG